MTTLDIVIPEYNFVCTELVASLLTQCRAAVQLRAFSITVVDDASTHGETIARNQVINNWPHCRFMQNSVNAGRSATLNRGIRSSENELVLIVDCDAEVASPDFICKYLNHFENRDKEVSVVCGGILTSPQHLRSDNHLRYRYETAASKIRNLRFQRSHPYDYFSTFNVMMRRDVLREVSFNEELTRYGYEDTLFGLDLKKEKIPVSYIDNRLVHTGIDSNLSFLQKTETALRNLHDFNHLFGNTGTAVSRTAEALRRYHLAGAMRLWHRHCSTWERRNLLGSRPHLFLFKLYKLGYYISLPKP